MTKRNIPTMPLGARVGQRHYVSPQALQSWSPDLAVKSEGDSETTISILDPIGADMWGDGVTSKRIAGALRAIGKRDVTVVINSPGGDFFEGLAIYNMLREHPAQVTVKIVGMAASAASVIAMAGDVIQIAEAGFIMIHNTWVVAAGDRHKLRDVSDWLSQFDEAAVGLYQARSGIDAKEIAAMLDKETWLNGSRAIELGFADELLPRDDLQVSASADLDPSMRAEKVFDMIAAQAGMSKGAGRDLLQALKGGKSGAAPDGMSGAADVTEALTGLKSILNSFGV